MIKKMLEANGYDAKLLNKIRHQKRKEEKEVQNLAENNNKKWDIFTYFGNEVRAITKIFSKYNVRTAFRTKILWKIFRGHKIKKENLTIVEFIS
jgi:hypothetical protein